METKLRFDENTTTSLLGITTLAKDLLASTFFVKKSPLAMPIEVNLAELGWTFEFDGGKNRMGCCKSHKRTISVSKGIASRNLDKAMKIEDTIRHELAHALQHVAYGYSAHDAAWTYIARSVGSNGERCFSAKKEKLDMGESKYTVFCKTEGCETEHAYHKKPRKVASGTAACSNCCDKLNGGKFSYEYVLQYRQNF